MPDPRSRRVRFDERGRDGYVVYEEPAGSVQFYFAFGAGSTVATLQSDDEAAWSVHHPWVAGRRAEILRFVADEVVRLRAPTSRAEIDFAAGSIELRQSVVAATVRAPAVGGFALGAAKAKFAWIVLVVVLVGAAAAWLAKTVLSIRSDTGTPFGPSLRTGAHIATLIQALEPYVPSLHRNPANDRYRTGVFLVPLAGDAQPRLVPIVGEQPIGATRLARLLGDDGRTLWFDVVGLGGIDLLTFARVTVDDLQRANPSLDASWWEDTRGITVEGRLRLVARDRSRALEIDPATLRAVPADTASRATGALLPTGPGAYLAAGLCLSPTQWLGVHAADEAERDFAPGDWVRDVVRASDAIKVARRLYRGVLVDASLPERRAIASIAPVGDAEFVGAAFVCANDLQAPLRLREPDGVLMVYSSEPGLRSTLVAARVDADGNVLWRADTGIDRFGLLQILPGTRDCAFVGTRPRVPDKVSEPLLVFVDHERGALRTHSLWQ